MGQIFAESLYDAILDCLKVLPILFLAYLIVSFISHDHSRKFARFLTKKSTSVFYASFLGCVPQCGFSSVIADLYADKSVSLGTVVAVFVATSDEAIPIMISNSNVVVDMLIMIAIKLALALFWGYLVDFVISLFKKKKRTKIANVKAVHSQPEHEEIHSHEHHEHHEEHEHDHDHSSMKLHKHECGHIHTEKCESECGHKHGDCCVDNVFLDAFIHTMSIVVYIFLATLAINFIIGNWGLSALQNLLTTNPYIQVVVASLIGLIPNCASSVLLVELFISNTMCFPALIAGLTSGAGVGLFILWSRNKKQPLQNLGIMLLQYTIGVASGLFMTLFF